MDSLRLVALLAKAAIEHGFQEIPKERGKAEAVLEMLGILNNRIGSKA
jgi:hypothetical protein